MMFTSKFKMPEPVEIWRTLCWLAEMAQNNVTFFLIRYCIFSHRNVGVTIPGQEIGRCVTVG